MLNKLGVIAGASLVATLLFAAAPPAGASPMAPSIGHLVRAARLAADEVPAGAVDLGRYGASARMDIEVVLASSDPGGELALARSEYEPSSPLYHHWLTPTQFDAEFGPSPSELDATEAWLSSRGLDARRSSEFALTVQATEAQVSSALGTSFDGYRAGPLVGYAARQAPLVPEAVEGDLTGILGLDTLVRPEAQLVSASAARSPISAARAAEAERASPRPAGAPSDCQYATDAATGGNGPGYTMLGEADASGLSQMWSAGLEGRGQTIGLYELANFYAPDVTAYESCEGLDNPVSVVGSAPYDYSGGTAEADIDIEQAITDAPQASVVVYEANGNSDNPATFYNLWGTIVGQDKAQTVSTSWGECEPDNPSGFMSAVDGLLEQAALQGQSVFSAAGDSGSEDCAYDYVAAGGGPGTPSYWNQLEVDYPSSSPWITAVGGTALDANDNLEAWNDCLDDYSQTGADSPCLQGASAAYHAGGGGVSTVEAAAPWQQSYFADHSGSPGAGCGSVCRAVPDVATDAGYPVTAYSCADGADQPGPESASDQGCWGLYVGTSLGSPYMAGLAADRNQGCETTTGSFAGLAYGLASTANGYGDAFLDVQEGNNDMLDDHGGAYPAGPGYDMATGLGTPIPVGVACPEVGGVAPASAAPGSVVTVSGIGLEAANIYFGGALAPLAPGTTPSATSVQVVVPQGSGDADVYGALDGESGTISAPFAFASGGTTPATDCASATGIPLVGAVGIAAVDIDGCDGYFVADAQGRVAAFGSATTHGDATGVKLAAPIIAIAATNDGEGYYLLGADGGVFTFGDAVFHGSTGDLKLVAPIVGMAVTPSGSGYWLVAADGGVFSFGNAVFRGSMGGHKLDKPVVGMAVAPGGNGYWLVAADGGVFTFTPDGFYGSMGDTKLVEPVVGMSSTPDGHGYTLVAADGGVFNFGDSTFYGSLGADRNAGTIVDLSPTPSDNGYYLVNSAGEVWAFGPGAEYFGGT